MAKQHTLATKQETTNGDIPVVAPMNMGKGILWDDKTKTYYVAVDEKVFTIDAAGKLSLRISALENNLLKVMNDGVYYGTKARPELATLYVDAVNGIDQNPFTVKGAGSISKPLKTLKYAIELAEEYTTRVIRIKEGQDHIIDSAATIKSGYLTIKPYGDKFDELNNYYRNEFLVNETLSKDPVKRPKIVFRGVDKVPYNHTTDTFIRPIWTRINVAKDSVVSITGVEICNDLSTDFVYEDGPNKSPTRSNRQVTPYRINSTLSSTELEITNCVFTDRNNPAVSGYRLNNDKNTLVDNLFQKDDKNRWKVGLFSGGSSKFVLQNIFETPKNSYLFNVTGWNPVLLSTAALSVSGSNQKDIANAFSFIQYTTQPSGDKIITAPIINIPPQEFGL